MTSTYYILSLSWLTIIFLNELIYTGKVLQVVLYDDTLSYPYFSDFIIYDVNPWDELYTAVYFSGETLNILPLRIIT